MKRQKKTTPTGLEWQVQMSNHLTKVNLFKKWTYPSWSIYKYGDMAITIKKDNQVTNWTKYIDVCKKSSLEGTGYTLNLYKRGQGIKRATIKKPNKTNIVKDFKSGLIQYGLERGFINHG